MPEADIQNIIDSALEEFEQLKPGQSYEAILEKYPEYKEELSGIFAMAELARSLPHNTVPRPTRRHAYKAAMHVPWQTRLQIILRWSLIPATAAFLLVGGTEFAQATNQSLPGEALFTVKRAGERVRVAMATDPNEKANLEIEYTQKRITEVQTVLQQEDSSPGQQAEAIKELKAQSQKAFETVPQVAASNIIAKKDDNLLKTLIAVNNQQKDILEDAAVKEEAQAVASTALQVTEDNGKALVTLLAAANEQALTDLNNRISITGQVQTVDSTRKLVTVENNSFSITGETEIKSGTDSLQLSGLTPKSQVTIIGNKTDTGMVASKIEVLALNPAIATGEVKGTATATPRPTAPAPVKPTNSAATEPAATEPAPDPASSSPQPADPAEDPNTVTGGYLLEQPQSE